MESTLRTVSLYGRLTKGFAGGDAITLCPGLALMGAGIVYAATPPKTATKVAEAASHARLFFDGFAE
jgi:hypothetical protein